jgi:hypothetical protein
MKSGPELFGRCLQRLSPDGEIVEDDKEPNPRLGGSGS